MPQLPRQSPALGGAANAPYMTPFASPDASAWIRCSAKPASHLAGTNQVSEDTSPFHCSQGTLNSETIFPKRVGMVLQVASWPGSTLWLLIKLVSLFLEEVTTTLLCDISGFPGGGAT